MQTKNKQKTRRLFIAAVLPGALHAEIVATVARVSKLDPSASCVPSQNLHLTLRFIGDVTAAKADEIQRVLSDLDVMASHQRLVSFERYGFFTSGDRATLVARLHAADVLYSDVQRIDEALQQVGMLTHRKRWTPHVTLARRVASERIDLSLFDSPLLPPEAVPAINLYLSDRTPHGMHYTVLQTLFKWGE